MKNRRFTSALVAVLASAVLGSVAPAYAAPAKDNADLLVELSSGLSRADIVKMAESTAKQKDVSVEAVLAKAAKEATAAKKAAEARGVKVAKPSAITASSLSGGGSLPLRPSWYAGDVFVSTAGLLWYGHAGIYANTTTVVHAPGGNSLSQSAYYYNVGVGSGSVTTYVSTSQYWRDRAASFAWNYLRGKAYNVNFWDNHYVWSSAYNCSQLVWAAYRGSSGIDLDGNGGWGVYPWDLEKSGWTQIYRRY